MFKFLSRVGIALIWTQVCLAFNKELPDFLNQSFDETKKNDELHQIPRLSQSDEDCIKIDDDSILCRLKKDFIDIDFQYKDSEFDHLAQLFNEIETMTNYELHEMATLCRDMEFNLSNAMCIEEDLNKFDCEDIVPLVPPKSLGKEWDRAIKFFNKTYKKGKIKSLKQNGPSLLETGIYKIDVDEFNIGDYIYFDKTRFRVNQSANRREFLNGIYVNIKKLNLRKKRPTSKYTIPGIKIYIFEFENIFRSFLYVP